MQYKDVIGVVGRKSGVGRDAKRQIRFNQTIGTLEVVSVSQNDQVSTFGKRQSGQRLADHLGTDPTWVSHRDAESAHNALAAGLADCTLPSAS